MSSPEFQDELRKSLEDIRVSSSETAKLVAITANDIIWIKDGINQRTLQEQARVQNQERRLGALERKWKYSSGLMAGALAMLAGKFGISIWPSGG